MAPRELALVRLDELAGEVRPRRGRESVLDPAEHHPVRPPQDVHDLLRQSHSPSPTVRGVPLRMAAVVGVVDAFDRRTGELDRDAREGPRRWAVDELGADVRDVRGRGVDAMDEGDGVVLGVVALAPNRVLRYGRPADR